MKEVIKDGETGYLVQDKAEAVSCVQRIETIDRRHCREWVEEKFSQNRMVQDYIKVYQQILGY